MSKDNYTQKLIEQFKSKYGLSKNDFWNLARGGKDTWIIKHNALERAAAHEKISWSIEVLNFNPDIVVKCTAKHGDRQVESLGEASPKNTKQAYPYAMAEKRAVDRCILKLLNAHAYLYSDIEADEFKQSKDEQTQQSRPQPQRQQETNTSNNGGGGDYVSRMEALLQRVPKGHFYEGFLIDRLAKHQQWDNVRWSDKQVALLSKAEHEFPAAPF